MTTFEPVELARQVLKDGEIALTDGPSARIAWIRNRFAAWKEHGPVETELISFNRMFNHIAHLAQAGDPYARSACLEAAAELLSEGKQMPPAIAQFVSNFCLDASKSVTRTGVRGPNPYKNIERDEVIGFAVFIVRETYDLPATRSETQKQSDGPPTSACAAVTKALSSLGMELSEGAVEKVWLKYDHIELSETIPPINSVT